MHTLNFINNTYPFKKKCITDICVTLWTLALQVPLSMGFPRQEYWSGLPFPPPVDLPNPGIKPTSPALAGRFLTTEPPGMPSCPPWRERNGSKGLD